jgi:enoyl-CoA hydratase/carnithine racemase
MFVELRREGHIAELSMAAADVRNALGPDDAREMRLAMESIASQRETRAVVVSADGPAFCAGGNLRKLMEMIGGGESVVRDVIYKEFQGLFRAISELEVPLICAVDGPAVGLGCDLALAGDITFIGSSGYLAQGWASLGLIPAPGGTRLIMQRGGSRALWKLLSTPKMDGMTAQEFGLGVACESARMSALEAAQALARLPPEAIRATKHLSRIDDFNEHLKTGLAFQAGFLTSAEFARRAEKILSRA